MGTMTLRSGSLVWSGYGNVSEKGKGGYIVHCWRQDPYDQGLRILIK